MSKERLRPLLIEDDPRETSPRSATTLEAGAQECLIKGEFATSDPLRSIDRSIRSQQAQNMIEGRAARTHDADKGLRDLIENNADGILIIDGQGRVRFANPAAELITGRSSAELLGQNFGFPLVAGKTTEIDIVRPDIRPRVAELRVVETPWKGETAYLVSMRDVTENRALQQKLKDAQRQELEMKDRFLSLVSHELRSPLTTIHILVSNTVDGLHGEVNSEQRDHLSTVLRSVDALRRMIDELLDATRARTDKLRNEPMPMELPGIVEDTINSVKPAAKSKGVDLSCRIPADLPALYADPRRVRDILVNLVENGIKFTPEGGSVTVSAGVFVEDAGSVRIMVSDTGCGIDAEDQEKIFDYLSQTEEPPVHGGRGLGLGLYISRELVSRNGGRIWVSSELDRGSTFSFTLPTYSLTRLLDPVLTPENLEKGSVTVIEVRLYRTDPPIDAVTFVRGVWEMKALLERCSLPDLDVVLPPVMETDGVRVIRIVACAREHEMTILTGRIREHAARTIKAKDFGMLYDITWFSIDTSPFLRSGFPEQVRKKVADEVERVILDSAFEGERTI